MEIKKYFNLSEEQFKRKDKNIFIPICLGNKFFFNKNVPSENIKKYLDWALEHTKEKVLFVIVDKIQDTNFFVRNNRTERASTAYVLKQGEIIKNEIQNIVDQLSEKKRERIIVIQWEKYELEDPFWAHTTQLIYKEFKNKTEFTNKVVNAVKNSITDRDFTEDEYWRLCDYVLDEFSIVYSGITYKNTLYNLYPYPNTDTVLELVEAIKKGSIFLDLNKKLPDTKTDVIIVR